MAFKNLTRAIVFASAGFIALTGCSAGHELNLGGAGHASNGTAVQDSGNVAQPKGLGMDPAQRGGNYYEPMGTATFTNGCDSQPAGSYNYTGVQSNGQVGPACGVITTGKGGHQPQEDPAGYKGNNSRTTIPSIAGGKSYRGYFYNRSHLIGRALGGQGTAENLVTGTRMQNVGESNEGGMRYGEKIAEAYVKSGAAQTCPLTYQVTPHYANKTDEVPTWVEQDMKSCDGKINQRIGTFNDANGYTIDYATGVATRH